MARTSFTLSRISNFCLIANSLVMRCQYMSILCIYIYVYIYIYPRYCIHWPLIDVVSHIFTLKTHVLADCFCNHPLLGWVRALHRSTTRSIVALNPQRSPECNWCVAASWTSLNTHILYIYILHISIIYKLHIYHINVYIYIFIDFIWI